MTDPTPPHFAHAHEVPRPPARADAVEDYVIDFFIRHGFPLTDALDAIHGANPAMLRSQADYVYHAEVAIAQAHETYLELRLAQILHRRLPFAYIAAVAGLAIAQFTPAPWSVLITILSAAIPIVYFIRIAANLKASRP